LFEANEKTVGVDENNDETEHKQVSEREHGETDNAAASLACGAGRRKRAPSTARGDEAMARGLPPSKTWPRSSGPGALVHLVARLGDAFRRAWRRYGVCER
jgi:hypothetical protein